MNGKVKVSPLEAEDTPSSYCLLTEKTNLCLDHDETMTGFQMGGQAFAVTPKDGCVF